MTVSVAVVGLGTIGVHAAHRLRLAGAEVVGYDQFGLAHGFGSAGGDSRLYSRVELSDPRYLEVIRRAEELWCELSEASGARLLTLTGGLIMGDPRDVTTRAAFDSSAVSPGARELSRTEFAERFPALRLADGESVLYDPHVGRIDPELSIAQVGGLARASGAQLRLRCAVTRIEPRDGGIGVQSDGGWETFDRVVVTAGAWTPKLLGAAAPRLAVRRLTSAWYFPREAASFASLVPFMRVEPDYVYGLPSADSRSVKLGLGFDAHLPVEDPDRVERWVRPGDLHQDFADRVSRYLPGFAAEPFRVETYFETYSPSRREYLSEVPGCDGAFVLAGLSGHGFKVAPALGEAIAESVLDGRHRYPDDLFLRV